MRETGFLKKCTISNMSRVIVIISILAIAPISNSCVAVNEAKHDKGSVKGPGRQSDLKCLGQLRPRHSEEITGSQWGVACHWIADPPHELTTDQQVEQLAWLGAKWGFLCPDWNRIETVKGKYDFNSSVHPFDDAVVGMVRRKIKPIIQIYGGNQLYLPAKLDDNKRQMGDAALLLDDPAASQAWHLYLEAIVRKYKTHVNVWEIWNEPNSSYFWQRQGEFFEPPVSDYGRIVKEAASVIRSIQPEAVIIAGSTAFVELGYLEDFLSSEGAAFFDHWSVHPYGELPESSDTVILHAQQILADQGKSTVMWQSECGFPSSGDTGGWGWGGPWDETKHAKWVMRRLLSDAATGLQPSIIFVLNDYPSMIENQRIMGINRKGLYSYGSWEPKPGAYAFRNLASIVDDRLEPDPANVSLEIAAPDSISPDQIRTYTLKERSTGSAVVVYWLAVPMETDFTVSSIQISLNENTIDQPVLVDLLDGLVYEVVLDDEDRMVFEGLPLADSPLVLCSRHLIELIPKGRQ